MEGIFVNKQLQFRKYAMVISLNTTTVTVNKNNLRITNPRISYTIITNPIIFCIQIKQP